MLRLRLTLNLSFAKMDLTLNIGDCSIFVRFHIPYPDVFPDVIARREALLRLTADRAQMEHLTLSHLVS